jgi:hypothetical protein
MAAQRELLQGSSRYDSFESMACQLVRPSKSGFEFARFRLCAASSEMSLAFHGNTEHDLVSASGVPCDKLPTADLMSQRSAQCLNSSINHRTFQQVLCLLICVCAWRGPVPVLHDHDAVKSSELQTRHAQAFHDGQAD